MWRNSYQKTLWPGGCRQATQGNGDSACFPISRLMGPVGNTNQKAQPEELAASAGWPRGAGCAEGSASGRLRLVAVLGRVRHEGSCP